MLTQGSDLLVQKVNDLEAALLAGGQTIYDAYALNLLQPLLNGYPFIPFTGASLRPFCLLHMLNDIVINDRKNIIEFGSGLSTIMIGRLIKKNNLDTKVLSVEHDEGWIQALTGILKKENTGDVVTLLHAPLQACALTAMNTHWYNLEVLRKEVQQQEFDMVIVDGPPAWQKGKERARYPALPFIKDRLKDRFSVYLDDVNRPGEQAILQSWKREYGFEFTTAGGSLSYYYSKDSFYTEPFTNY